MPAGENPKSKDRELKSLQVQQALIYCSFLSLNNGWKKKFKNKTKKTTSV